MTDKIDNIESEAPTAADDGFDRLFEHTSPRQRPLESEERMIRESLHAEWDEVVGRRIRVARLTWLAAAASVLVLIGAVLAAVRPSLLFVEPPIVAQLERVSGDVELTTAAGQSLSENAAQPGLEIVGEQLVTTGNGGAAFRLAEGGSLRITTNTRVRLISSNEVELIRGALYFDSQDAADRIEQLVVHTRLGALRDVGTQFIARLEPEVLLVSVREGAVAIDRQDESIEATTGLRISVPGAGRVSRESIALFGEEWDWAEELAPMYDIDGQSLSEFLTWIERQTGRPVAYNSPDAERIARDTILRGSIDLEPMPMLRAVLETTDLNYATVAGGISISLR